MSETTFEMAAANAINDFANGIRQAIQLAYDWLVENVIKPIHRLLTSPQMYCLMIKIRRAMHGDKVRRRKRNRRREFIMQRRRMVCG